MIFKQKELKVVDKLDDLLKDLEKKLNSFPLKSELASFIKNTNQSNFKLTPNQLFDSLNKSEEKIIKLINNLYTKHRENLFIDFTQLLQIYFPENMKRFQHKTTINLDSMNRNLYEYITYDEYKLLQDYFTKSYFLLRFCSDKIYSFGLCG